MKIKLLSALSILLILILVACNTRSADENSVTKTNKDFPSLINSATPTSFSNEGEFPALHITTLGEEELFVERDLRVESTLTLTNAPAEFQFADITATVRGRGNSTWWAGEGKRPLRFRFDVPQSMLGSNYEARDWILLANHFDRSLMRNHFALYLASLLDGLDWTPRTHFLHLYVNDEYMGVYQLTDEREVSPDRISLTFDPDPAVSEYFLELDARAGHDEDALADEDFFTAGIRDYDVRFPDEDDRNGHTIYARDFVYNVSQVIRSGIFEDIESVIDISSFIDFYIVQEVSKNTDVWWLSVFMQIRGQADERKLYMGPVWDFDLSAGNSARAPASIENYMDVEHSPYSLADYSPYLDYQPYGLFAGLYNYWYYYLLNVPEFRELVVARWNEVRDNQIAQTIDQLYYMATTYQSEFERNFDRHPILGEVRWRSPDEINEITTFMGQVEHLIAWLETRVDWLDNYFNERN